MLSGLLGLYAGHLAVRAGTHGALGRVIDDGLYNAAIIAMGVVCAGRALRRDKERWGWLLLGAAIAVWALGNTYWALLLPDQNTFPSLADAFWLGFYVLAYAGMALVFRARLPHVSVNVWADGIVAGLTVSAVAAALVFDAVLQATHGNAVAVAVNLAYPIGDTVLLALVVAAVGLSGFHIGRSWALAAAGIAVFAVTDSIYLYQVSAGTYDQFGLMNVGWPLGCLLLAYAAWQPAEAAKAREEGWSGIGVSVACASFAIAVLVYDHFHRLSAVTLALAAAVLIAVLARLALTFRDHLRLIATSRTDALTDQVTGLGNRRALLEHLADQLGRCDDQRQLVLVLLDLNGFKEYNDSFGHLAGDALLARLGRRLQAALPAGGRAFRMGGDEFCAVVLTDAVAAPRLGALAGVALSDRGEGFDVDSAWGLVAAPDEADTPVEILKLADRRMYASKAERSTLGRQTARLLVRALEDREPTRGEEVSQVANIAVAVGREMGLTGQRLELLRQVAELHDVGKMAIPDAILLKTGPLDDDDWVFVRRHTLTGEWILSAAAALTTVAKLVRSTQERWDGAGYPDGLAGTRIPLEARVVAVCEAYAAMRAHRPYRAALTHEEALAELRAGAGTQFDPAVVDAATTVLEAPLRLVAPMAVA
ncbi:MAG TPA: HD domain-containing phosphohydrolase [Gaiellaceae bacterium]|nr:HD domain-containing phosphohydrolase [Gaiellaceae bacterium]